MKPFELSEKITVLVIDDEPVNLKLLVAFLEDNFEVVVSTSGESGLTRAEHVKPDLIILDVSMPGIDGFETCRRLKSNKHTSRIPVIFMTALNALEDKIMGFDAGGVDYITKPIQIKEAVVRIETHLKISKLQEDLRQSEARFRSLSDATFEGIAISRQGRIVESNDLLAKMFGYKTKELVGKDVIELVSPEERDNVTTKISEGYQLSYESTCLRKDGTTFPVEIQTKMYMYKKEEVKVSAIRDITLRKQAEEEVRILRGILPICSFCKKIRDDKGSWEQLEAYISDHSQVLFSHGVCPKCEEKHFGDINKGS
jgi:PAS domain S-box-containing protein